MVKPALRLALSMALSDIEETPAFLRTQSVEQADGATAHDDADSPIMPGADTVEEGDDNRPHNQYK